MKCYKHSDIDAVGACTSCGHFVCEDCKIEINGKIICKECVSNGNRVTNARSSQSSHAAVVQESGMLIKIVSGITILYAVYSFFTTAISVFRSITDDSFHFSFNQFIWVLILIGTIVYCLLKIFEPAKSGSVIPAVILFVLSLISGIYSNVVIGRIFKNYEWKLPFGFFLSWYLIPLLLLVLIVMSATNKKVKHN